MYCRERSTGNYGGDVGDCDETLERVNGARPPDDGTRSARPSRRPIRNKTACLPAEAGSAQNDHRAGRMCHNVLAHRAKQHAGEAPATV
jgi:hypothetical protein